MKRWRVLGRHRWIGLACLLTGAMAGAILLTNLRQPESMAPAAAGGRARLEGPNDWRGARAPQTDESLESLAGFQGRPTRRPLRPEGRLQRSPEYVPSSPPSRTARQLVYDLEILLASRREFADARAYRESYAELRREIVARGDESRPVLEAKLASVDTPARVRRASANLLGAIRSEASLPLLADVLREDPDDEVRRLAARAVGNYWDTPRARQILIDELVHGEPFSGSYAVVFSLSEFGDPADIELFEELAVNDEDVSVRTQAVHALGRFGDRALIPFLESVAQNDPHPDPRVMAAEVLADLRP